VKYAFIDEEKGKLPVSAMCRELGVSVSGFYRWAARRGQPDRRKLANEPELQRAIVKPHRASRGRYGRPRILALLEQQGYRVGGARVRRIMLELGLSGRSGRKSTRRRREEETSTSLASNLLARKFTVSKPNTVWTGDITEIRVGRSKIYLAVVIDLHSRAVVGWKVSKRMTADIVTGALKAAVRRRKPPRGLLFHSDQGAQYSSQRFRRMLAALHFRQSMSRRGNCWDNSPTESFFATLKKELVYTPDWESASNPERLLTRYINFYNRERLHTALGLRSPRAYEEQTPR
jgi:putative transposase